MTNQTGAATDTPIPVLIEQLEAVPADAVFIVSSEVPPLVYQVGKLCHEAATELRRLTEVTP